MLGTTSAAASSAATQTTAAPAAQATTAQATTAQATNAQALTALGSHLNDFLKMLMTQLQNQDPTQPLDSSQFTSQLVQFASVEQQVNANTNLTTLIQLQQGNEMVQAGALVGKQVTAQSSTLDLKNGSASLTLSPTTSEPVTVAITSPAGVALTTRTVQAAPGGTGWTWNRLRAEPARRHLQRRRHRRERQGRSLRGLGHRRQRAEERLGRDAHPR